jgi:hypothetical protein
MVAHIVNIPDTWETGTFQLVELGVYVRLDGPIGVVFSGNYRHGGTPPMAPLGTIPDPRVVRFTYIWYPNSVIVTGQGQIALSPSTGGEVLRIDRTMMNPEM